MEAIKTKQIPPKRKKRRLLLRTLAIVLTLLLLSTALSPAVVSYLVRAAFTYDIATAPEGYGAMQAAVTATKNLTYPSAYRENLADIYIPKEGDGPFPVLIWVHGGGFVGGSKQDNEIYATSLAAEGLAVVSMNYQRAPEANYPTPVIQIGEVIHWLTELAPAYRLDMDRFALAGDSAGAHAAAQFAALQTNPAYAQALDLAPSIPIKNLKATVLFCGPYDVERIAEHDSAIFRFLMGQTAWAYFGRRDWARQLGEQATIMNHITADFPPTFLTDGNTASFEDHSRFLEAALLTKQVPVQSFYISKDDAITIHEYQFLMDTPVGAAVFDEVAAFLKEYL